eukprot:EG_transcript_30376
MLALCMAFLAFQGLRKQAFAVAARQRNEEYDRWADLRMLAVDRLVGNTLEWLPIFLGLFWLSLVLTAGRTLPLGWVYVASRALYAVLALNGGICRAGIRWRILLATVPSYVVLFTLLSSVVKGVL